MAKQRKALRRTVIHELTISRVKGSDHAYCSCGQFIGCYVSTRASQEAHDAHVRIAKAAELRDHFAARRIGFS